MILVTVGTQLPFDRLVQAMDAIQPGLGIEVIAQNWTGSYQPQNIAVQERFGPAEFEQLARRSALIVAHAGIGSVLTARRLGKPIVLMPRTSGFGEHRSDHQLATARKLVGKPGVFIAMDETELPGAIAKGLAAGDISPAENPGARQLVDAVAEFVHAGGTR